MPALRELETGKRTLVSANRPDYAHDGRREPPMSFSHHSAPLYGHSEWQRMSMKLEVIGTFLAILNNFGNEPSQLNFRSDGILPNASALDVAASTANVHAVKNLVKKGAHLGAEGSRESALEIVKTQSEEAGAHEYMERKNLERCGYIVEFWEASGEADRRARRLTDDWTNMRTVDESRVNSSWEVTEN